MPPITLPNNPVAALAEIAGYLRTLQMSPDRRGVKDGEVVGHYQTTEWLEGLLEIATECDRLGKLYQKP